MSSPTAQESPDPLERLLANARSILRRHHKTHDLTGLLGSKGPTNHAEIEYLRESTSIPELPEELTDALRSPAGGQEVLNLVVGGKPVQAVVPCLGRADVHVEREVWRVICDTALRGDR